MAVLQSGSRLRACGTFQLRIRTLVRLFLANGLFDAVQMRGAAEQ